MNAAALKPVPARVVALAKVVKLPTKREFYESRPAVDPVLIRLLSERGAK